MFGALHAVCNRPGKLFPEETLFFGLGAAHAVEARGRKVTSAAGKHTPPGTATQCPSGRYSATSTHLRPHTASTDPTDSSRDETSAWPTRETRIEQPACGFEPARQLAHELAGA